MRTGTEKVAAEARRRADMVRAYVSGEILRSLADRYGISTQRVHQIVSRYGVRQVPLRRRSCSVCGQWLYAGFICQSHVADLLDDWSGLVVLQGGATPAEPPPGAPGGVRELLTDE